MYIKKGKWKLARQVLRILYPPKVVSKTMYFTSLEDRGELIFVIVNNNKFLGSTE